MSHKRPLLHVRVTAFTLETYRQLPTLYLPPFQAFASVLCLCMIQSCLASVFVTGETRFALAKYQAP